MRLDNGRLVGAQARHGFCIYDNYPATVPTNPLSTRDQAVSAANLLPIPRHSWGCRSAGAIHTAGACPTSISIYGAYKWALPTLRRSGPGQLVPGEQCPQQPFLDQHSDLWGKGDDREVRARRLEPTSATATSPGRSPFWDSGPPSCPHLPGVRDREPTASPARLSAPLRADGRCGSPDLGQQRAVGPVALFLRGAVGRGGCATPTGPANCWRPGAGREGDATLPERKHLVREREVRGLVRSLPALTAEAAVWWFVSGLVKDPERPRQRYWKRRSNSSGRRCAATPNARRRLGSTSWRMWSECGADFRTWPPTTS